MKLLLGSGNLTKEGYTTIDALPLPNVDIVHDLEKKPWPIAESSVDIVNARNVLEHLRDTVSVMEEIYRICKDDAKVIIRVPYFKSTAHFKQPDHVSFFTERTFDFFDRRNFAQVDRDMCTAYQLKADFRVEKITYNYYMRGMRFMPFRGFLRRHFWDIVKTIVYELRVVKPGAPKAEES